MADPVRVLFVDDEPEGANRTATALEREDERLRVETATDASEALDRVATGAFDCVVADYGAPGRDGLAFLEAVREVDDDLPFVLFTATGNEAVASDAIAAGVTDYLRRDTGTDQYAVLANRIRSAVAYRRSRRSLAEREERMRRYEYVVDSMHEAACVYDEDDRFELVNEYLADWYGTTPEALEGEPSILLPEVRADHDGDPIRDLREGEREEVRGEYEADFPTHGHAVLEYQLTPLTVDGVVEGIVGVARDVTERKEREREVERQNERLEKFARIVSHDLRNPLNVAEGYLELARGDCESEYLDRLVRVRDRMETLVDDVLTLARTGDVARDLEAVDLPTLVENCWRNVPTTDATLVVETERTIRADRSRIQQLFENLFVNAVQHGGEGVTVTVGDCPDGFYVADDGPGIPPDERDDVFEAGYSTTADGTGFGLNIVRTVAIAHGWQVAVTDSADDGTRFEVTGVDAAE